MMTLTTAAGGDPEASATTIIEAVADRSAIEQNFHDVKEVHGAGQQQVRNVWCNVACWNLCLWLHTIVELWSWRRSGKTLKQRTDRPWDDPARRPSHADRLKTLRKQILRETFSALPRPIRYARKSSSSSTHLSDSQHNLHNCPKVQNTRDEDGKAPLYYCDDSEQGRSDAIKAAFRK